MDLLKNLSVRAKLFLISFIPLLVFGYFLIENIDEAFRTRNNSLLTDSTFKEIETISNLIHEIQLERGMAFGFQVAQRKGVETQLREQRNKTDHAIYTLKELFRLKNKEFRYSGMLDSISLSRDNGLFYLDFLNDVKSVLIQEIAETSRVSYNTVIQHDLIAHSRLVQAKDYLARIRSITEVAILSKSFKEDNFAVFASLVGQYQNTMEGFTRNASPQLKDYFYKKFDGPEITRTLDLINLLYHDPALTESTSEEDWWSLTTFSINTLKYVEDFSLNLIKDTVQEELMVSNRSVLVSVIAGLMLIGFVTTLVLLIISQITGSINEIKHAAEKITQGEIDFEIDERGHDELSALAKSFNQMMSVSRQYVHIADTIGKGDYTPYIKVRSNADLLGKALISMKNNLHQLSLENENRTWLLTGNSGVNDSIHGDKDLKTLTTDILNATINYLKGQVGTMYVKENGSLIRCSDYAWKGSDNKQIKMGEGLVGQAAKDGKATVMSDLPADYMRITSSLGETSPKNLIIFPFLYEGEVKGVMEIGTTKAVSDLDIQFLENVSNNIAIAIQAAQAREQLKQLLEETQRQSEELASQQEELTIANEELQQKTELLERSEEELRVQQRELQETNEELYKKAALLEEQKQEIEISKARLEEKAQELELTNQYKSEFLANMSHELRTPLNSILILSQVLIENRNNKLTEKEIQFSQTIFNSGADLMALINEILDLSKIEAGKMELEIEPFNLNEVIQSIEDSFLELANRKSISFDIDVKDSLSGKEIISDSQRLEQVVKNFLSNAFKFTEERGTVSLRIEKADKSTKFRNEKLVDADEVLAFSVSDTGIGIPPAKFGPIFEAFQQGDGSTKRKYGGTGLGLSISRELANLLGGEIHVQSKVGEGSTFTLFIPVQYQGPTNNTLPSVHVAVPITSQNRSEEESNDNGIGSAILSGDFADRKILVLEEDPAFAKVLINLIEERNYKGILADHAILGINYARFYKPDAIIINSKLSDMNGIEVLRHLKKDPELRHIPVQIISPEKQKEKIIELGAFDVVKKPLTKKDFWEILDKLEDFVTRKIKKLLIVEDNKQQNEAIQELIGNGDVKCFAAYSGEEAFESLLDQSFDCVILDLGLPGMTGFDLLEKIKDTPPTSRIPIIIYTGRSLSKEENARLEKLSDAIVMKTAFSHERLLDETTLFLHRVESKLPREKQDIIRKLHKTDEILRNKKVLIADDDVRNVYSLVAAFEQEGLICVVAENGKAALKVLENNRDIDIVMMDVMMPEMDGYETTREIRKKQEFKQLPIIALTAKAMKGDREKCLAAGMSDYVSKPINVQQLLSLMRVWLYA